MDNNRLQNSYVYIILGLLAATFSAAVYIAVRCYKLYSLASPLGEDAKAVLWTLMILPSVILPIALWLANMLNPTLSRLSLLSVLLNCCFFAAVPRLYSFGDGADMSYITSSFTFFLVMCTVILVVRDIKKKELPKLLNLIFGIIPTLGFALMTVYIAYFVLNIDFMDRVVICCVVPMMCGIGMICGILDLFSGATVILNTITLGYGTLCAAFEGMNVKVLYILFVGLCALTFIWQIIDIIKYIRSKENDSKSCNA